MEQESDVYRCPYDCEYPVVCVGQNHFPGHVQSDHPSSGCALRSVRAGSGQNALGSVRIRVHVQARKMAEAQVSVMSRQCLNRRIDSIDEVRSEIGVWPTHRDWIQTKIDWQFTSEDARIRLKRLYPILEE